MVKLLEGAKTYYFTVVDTEVPGLLEPCTIAQRCRCVITCYPSNGSMQVEECTRHIAAKQLDLTENELQLGRAKEHATAMEKKATEER